MKIDVLHAKNYNTPKLNYTIYRHRCPQCSSILQINASEKIPNKITCLLLIKTFLLEVNSWMLNFGILHHMRYNYDQNYKQPISV